jgi:uncharacterized membrane protein YiaA
MRIFNITLLGILIISASVGCSIQKRSLLPGYHIEWKKDATSSLLLDQTYVQHASTPNDIDDVYAAEASLSDEHLLASEVQPIYPSIIASLQHIPPSAIAREIQSSQLIEPTPWSEAEKKQQRFGKIALGAFLASVFLVAVGSPIAQLMSALGSYAYFLNRRYRKQVLDLKAANGIDVTEEQQRFRRTNRTITIVTVALLLFGLVMLTLVMSWLFGGGACFFC